MLDSPLGNITYPRRHACSLNRNLQPSPALFVFPNHPLLPPAAPVWINTGRLSSRSAAWHTWKQFASLWRQMKCLRKTTQQHRAPRGERRSWWFNNYYCVLRLALSCTCLLFCATFFFPFSIFLIGLYRLLLYLCPGERLHNADATIRAQESPRKKQTYGGVHIKLFSGM